MLFRSVPNSAENNSAQSVLQYANQLDVKKSKVVDLCMLGGIAAALKDSNFKKSSHLGTLHEAVVLKLISMIPYNLSQIASKWKNNSDPEQDEQTLQVLGITLDAARFLDHATKEINIDVVAKTLKRLEAIGPSLAAKGLEIGRAHV